MKKGSRELAEVSALSFPQCSDTVGWATGNWLVKTCANYPKDSLPEQLKEEKKLEPANAG